MKNPLANPLDEKTLDAELKIQIARSKDELHQAFSITYQSYLRAGLAVDHPSGLRLTPYHLLPDSEVIIAKQNGMVVSTISLFGDGKLGLPMQSMYSREIDILKSRGLRLAEIGSLADYRESPRRFLSTYAQMGRLLAQLTCARNVDAWVAVVHPKHARMYKRVLGFKQIGDHTDCPYANGNPAEALYLCFQDYVGSELYDRYFCDPYPSDQLEPYDWSAECRNYFGRILNCDGKIAKAIGLKDYYSWGVKYPDTKLDVTENLASPAG